MAMRTSITGGVEVVVGHGWIVALRHRTEVGTTARASSVFAEELPVVDSVDVCICQDLLIASHFRIPIPRFVR